MARKPWRGNVWIGLLMLLGFLALGVSPVWAAARFPQPTRAQQTDTWVCMQVTPGVPLNVRAGPGTRYGVLTALEAGSQVQAAEGRTLSAEGYRWVPIRTAEGLGGWAIMQRFMPCPQVDTAPSANLGNSLSDGVSASEGGLNVLEAVDQDGTLDHDEIAAISSAVVLLEVDTRWGWASGTGTLIDPRGIVVTNAHVVENATSILVSMLEDIDAQPVPRYQGTVLLQDSRMDVAVVGITADRYGNPISSASLELPYLPLPSTPSEMYRGDEVYIFGYPGIGDTYLVLTRGGIVSVEDGTLAGERMPLWYRTDAEIAPGNSGGLVVNGNGEFVGIPTFVESEDVTGGRLGGIRAAHVVLWVLGKMGGIEALIAPPVAMTTPEISSLNNEATPQIVGASVEVTHGARLGSREGIRFRALFTVSGWGGRLLNVGVRFFYHDAASTPLYNPWASPRYRDNTDALHVIKTVNVCCDVVDFVDDAAVELFFPYEAFGLERPGTYALKAQIVVENYDGTWEQTLSWEFFDLQVYP